MHMGPLIHPLPVSAIAAPAPTITQMAPHIAKSLEATLPEHFFHLDASAPAQFSTVFGAKPKRDVDAPPPAPIVRSNIDIEIQRKADELRAQLPDLAAKVITPGSMFYDPNLFPLIWSLTGHSLV